MTFTVAIAGASGYAGGELVRLVSAHPRFRLGTVTAHSQAGERLRDVQPHLVSVTDRELRPTDAAELAGHDLVFLALPHGQSAHITEQLGTGSVVVDCGADRRLERPADWEAYYGGPFAEPWSYGLPELPRPDLAGGRQRAVLRDARRIAAPGCNASAVTLGFAPLVHGGLIDESALSAVLAVGTSGAGKAAQTRLLASEVMGSTSAYAVGGSHRHIPEILQNLRRAGAQSPLLSFTPLLVPMSRGILATLTAPIAPGVEPDRLRQAVELYYRDEPFVRVLPPGQWPRTADTVGANTALVSVDIDHAAGRAVILVALDNLVKGTAGAAVQCANLALGLPETEGLGLDGVSP